MPPKILVVDDESLIRIMMQRVLKKAGYDALEAANGREAREILGRGPVDLVLCDILMPGESGLDLARWIRQRHPEIALVMVTGVDDPQIAEAALELGAYGYIIKPFQPKQILISIVNALRRRDLEFREKRHREDLEEEIREKTKDLNRSIADLRQTAAQFQSLAEGSIQGILIHREFEPLFLNQALARIFGYSVEEMLALPSMLSLIAPHERERLLRYRDARLRGDPAPEHYEFQGLHREGTLLWLEGLVSVISWRGGPAIQLTLKDITDRKESEMALERSYREMEALVSGISSLIIGFSDSNRIVQWNKRAEELLGVRRQDAVGRSLEDLEAPWDQEGVRKAMDQCRALDAIVGLEALRYMRPDGREGFLGVTLHPLSGEEFRHPLVLMTGADVTEKRLLEMQLAQAQKLESIGQLAAGIAHEINTPIQYVGNNTRFMQEAFEALSGLCRLYGGLLETARETLPGLPLIPEIEERMEAIDLPYLDEEIPRAIRQTLDGVERVSRIVLSMKEFSHPGSDKKALADLNRALENTITVARNEWKYVADLEMDLDPALPPVPCVLGELNQVFLNVLVNAAQAIGEKVGDGSAGKGKIRISTRCVQGHAEIRISDTGPGIPQTIRDRVFDPFFTTKDPGKGTGQGLAISHTIVVRKHKGAIHVESEEGQGTTFVIRLPLGP